ncbi:MAG: hypothetical protein WAV50_03375 [Minisyncoccia bacterium]
MNVLETVRHRAGIKKRVLFGLVVLVAAIYVWHAEENQWMFVPAVAVIILAVFCERRIAIHVARENHKLMRSELQNMVRAETRMLAKYQDALATCLEKMRLDTFERAIFDDLWANSAQHRQDLIVLTLRKSVDTLRTIARDTDRVRRSERMYLFLRQKVQMYKAILAVLEPRGGLLAKKRKTQERDREFLKGSIAASGRVLGESRRLLVEYA